MTPEFPGPGKLIDQPASKLILLLNRRLHQLVLNAPHVRVPDLIRAWPELSMLHASTLARASFIVTRHDARLAATPNSSSLRRRGTSE